MRFVPWLKLLSLPARSCGSGLDSTVQLSHRAAAHTAKPQFSPLLVDVTDPT